ncbi:MAG: hypothetical protein A2Z20_07935 [Bdellovibrionales bacterium RBG_16_40_8]|nr:MAG: hypothetical protein A2Z20_07935 [Bdellovibrionales bacterium RBG_16_40_8]
MGRVLPFSQANDFVRAITAKGRTVRAILDTNILIASTYEISKDHEIVSALLISLAKLGVEFYATVSTRSEFMEFHRRLDWPIAAAIVEKTGLGISDSMIMNALNSSVCDFAISLDFDFGFATLADRQSKNVVMPDRSEREYRHYHFDVL